MTVELPEELTVARAAELRALLLGVLERGEALELDASAVAEADVAGLQVLFAARRSALARGLELTFSQRGRSEVVARVAAAAGLGRGGRSSDDAWLVEGPDRG